MPYSRPTLSDLRNQAANDLASALEGADPLLRFSILGILGQLIAGFSYLHYGYLDYIALQSVPFTATGEALEGWAAIVNVFREGATSATGQATFNGTNGKTILAGSTLTRSDGVNFTVNADATVSGGTVIVSATAVADSTGQTGAFGNTATGVTMSLAAPVAGIQAAGSVTTAFTGGADLEDDDSLRARMLFAYQNPPQGGSQTDYEEWAREVPGVTRAWCVPLGMGAGTVQVFFMMDQAEAAHGGFPQGTNGAATDEPRDTPAAGDQLTVANYIFSKRPATALVYSVAPIPNVVNFTISGISGVSTAIKNQISAAIVTAFVNYGEPGAVFDISYIESSIAAIPGTTGFAIVLPSGNIVNGTGELPTLGTIAYT